MSAAYLILIYPILVAVLWLWLTWLLLRFGWRRLRGKEEQRRSTRFLVGILIVGWLGASFWYSGGRKVYYDWRVDRMCAVDGGVKVFETVVLPAEKFNQFGQINFYRPDLGEGTLGPKYLYKSQNIYLHIGDPEMRKDHVQIFRKSDMKLLGEVIMYVRGGGDIPGPWQPSAHSCPDGSNANSVLLINRIFTNQGRDQNGDS